jgi:type IV secretory pathway TrbF-like protein
MPQNSPSPSPVSQAIAERASAFSPMQLLKAARFKKALPPTEARKFLHKQSRKEWDNRLGSAIKAALNWRRAFFGAMAVLGLQALGDIPLGRAVAAKPKAVPHVIEVDRIGVAHYRGPIGESGKVYNMSERSIRQHLKRFVTDLRSVSSDRAVITANILEAWEWSTTVGQNLINKYVADKNPYNRAVEERVSVEVQEILALSRDSWRVQWTETRYDSNGGQIDTVAWGGAFRLVFRLSEDGVTEEMLEKNPYGIYVDYFDVQQLAK